jgi:hypothetical protein
VRNSRIVDPRCRWCLAAGSAGALLKVLHSKGCPRPLFGFESAHYGACFCVASAASQLALTEFQRTEGTSIETRWNWIARIMTKHKAIPRDEHLLGAHHASVDGQLGASDEVIPRVAE